jgi:M6 family metalloprotease-like protein
MSAPSRWSALLAALLIALVAATALAEAAWAVEPPGPRGFGRPATLPQRLHRARSFGNDRVKPGRLRDLQLRMRSASGADTLSSVSPVGVPHSDEYMPSVGTVRMLTLLIDFSDEPANATNTNALVTDELFDASHADTRPGYPYDSLSNYYYRSSHGKLTIQGDVLGWYRSQKSRAQVDASYLPGNEASEATAREQLIEEALDYYDASVDYSQYDNNHDGTIDYLAVVWAGPYGEWASFWWGYQTEFWATNRTYDGMALGVYSWQFQSGQGDLQGEGRFSPLTVIHETGHALGLPDLYDYTPGTGDGPENGVGGFDMMDRNAFDHNGFSKWLLGWTQPKIVGGAGGTYSQPPNSTSDQAGIVVWPNAQADVNVPFGEFFYVENREPVGNDKYMDTNPGDGMGGVVVWHVDGTLDSLGAFAFNNSDTVHRLVKLVEAPGAYGIDQGYFYSWESFFYPGGHFGPSTTPSSARYSGTSSGVDVGVGSRSVYDVSVALGVSGQIGPANNAFGKASVISGISGKVSGDNYDATKETGEPAHAGQTGGASVWYRWTPSVTGTATVDTLLSDFDTLLGVYRGTSVSALTEVASNDDWDLEAGIDRSKVSFPVRAGTQYYIAVDGYDAAMGDIALRWSVTPASPSAPIASAVSPTIVSLWWEKVAGVGTYRIERAPSAAGPYAKVADVTTAYFADTRRSADTAYHYRVRSVAGTAVSAASAITSARTPAPLSVTVEQDATGVSYSGTWWNAPSGSLSGGAAKRSTSSGSKVTMPFRGGKVDFVGTKGPSYGKVNIALDGVIAVSAALVASALSSQAAGYWIAGHVSAEPGARAALAHLGMTPLLDLDLRLGEGSGAALAVPLVQSAARLLGEVATFDSAGVTEK